MLQLKEEELSAELEARGDHISHKSAPIHLNGKQRESANRKFTCVSTSKIKSCCVEESNRRYLKAGRRVPDRESTFVQNGHQYNNDASSAATRAYSSSAVEQTGP